MSNSLKKPFGVKFSMSCMIYCNFMWTWKIFQKRLLSNSKVFHIWYMKVFALVSLCKYEMWNKFIIIYSVSVHVHWQNWVNFLLLTIPKNQIASKFRDVLLNNKTQWSRDAKKSSMSFKEFLCLKSFSMGCNQGSSPKDLH